MRRLGNPNIGSNGPAIGIPFSLGNRSTGYRLVILYLELPAKEKAGVVEHPEVLDHVGLLVSERPGLAGLTIS